MFHCHKPRRRDRGLYETGRGISTPISPRRSLSTGGGARSKKKLVNRIGKFVRIFDHYRVAGMRNFAQLAIFQQAHDIQCFFFAQDRRT
jgi:hypothetical protein